MFVKTRVFLYCYNVKNSHYKKALAYVQKKHAGQVRDNGLPAWHHLMRVSAILEHTFAKTGEGDKREQEVIIRAALGHDIFEDTDATEKEVAEIFGARGLELIKGMTNRWGDKEKKKYVRQVVRSEEAVRLIKLADLCDNITSVAYNIKSLGCSWVLHYFLPIVTPMRHAIIKTRFRKYKRTASLLMFILSSAAMLLADEIGHSCSLRKK